MDAPVIRLSDTEHRKVNGAQSRNRKTREKMSAKELIEDDIKILEEYTNAPSSAIEKLKNMIEEEYGIDLD